MMDDPSAIIGWMTHLPLSPLSLGLCVIFFTIILRAFQGQMGEQWQSMDAQLPRLPINACCLQSSDKKSLSEFQVGHPPLSPHRMLGNMAQNSPDSFICTLRPPYRVLHFLPLLPQDIANSRDSIHC